MTMPHLMNCPHSSDGWCLECVKEMHDEFESCSITALLDAVGEFEETAEAGPGRELEDVSVRLWRDGSGEVLVKTAAATDTPGTERMLNRIFSTESRMPFENVGQLYRVLKNMDSIRPRHPEAQ